ncbi:protein of unknown function [Streptococcus thermophilus]|nr:protein of unknown function [Streptococcus thermophilus]CAD0123601.1 protein of unknown function [Streptococcus thermophilus]CAD0126425.1 protein of unknown function [Streptococcus thermophilus]CAD0127758.1 protein of unknown function [Streptococcus thermophilus]CAD0134088.1 protein of unknown function [Streptococcus thermophilus]
MLSSIVLFIENFNVMLQNSDNYFIRVILSAKEKTLPSSKRTKLS